MSKRHILPSAVLAATLVAAPVTPALATQHAPAAEQTSLSAALSDSIDTVLDDFEAWLTGFLDRWAEDREDGPGAPESPAPTGDAPEPAEPSASPSETPESPAPTVAPIGDKTPAPEPTQTEAPDVDARVQAVLDEHNAYRAKKGLDPVELSTEMSKVAVNWSKHMAEERDLEHNPDYSEQIPAGARASAENIAYDRADDDAVEDIMRGWIKSRGHERNITGDYTHVGIGLAEKNGRLWATVNFAAYDEAPAEEPTQAPSPEPTEAEEPTQEPSEEPTEAPAGTTTGGSGGPRTNQLDQSFTSNGLTSSYHLITEGLDWSKPVGVLVYADGSGGHGFDNPGSDYLIGGENGLAAIAAKHNLVLLVPEAPAPGCDGEDNCWYDRDLDAAAAKAQWSSDLLTQVKGQYDIDEDRVVVGGYSSGAQWTTQTFLPAHGAEQSVDLAVPIAYGGAPRTDLNAPEEWKNDVVISWDTGTSDPAYGTASWESVGGYNAYTEAGFTTDYLWPAGVAHGRSGDFGGILDREITEHLG